MVGGKLDRGCSAPVWGLRQGHPGVLDPSGGVTEREPVAVGELGPTARSCTATGRRGPGNGATPGGQPDRASPAGPSR